MPQFNTLDDIHVAGKRVLLRLDLNVPMRDATVTDATRIRRVAPTIKELMAAGARVVILSHFGRPKGVRQADMSLRPLVAPLAAALGIDQLPFAEDCIGPAAETVVAGLADGAVALLENLRFHPGEETNDAAFSDGLAALGDYYVNDAFSAAHRAHASIDGLARRLPAAAGRSMQAELEALDSALGNPSRPVMAVVGGAKVSTKLELLGNLVSKVDHLVIGGGMANTFLFARGISIGTSLAERDLADTARDIEAKAAAAGCQIHLQTDAAIAAKLAVDTPTRNVAITAVPADQMILDIGPQSVAYFAEALAKMRTLVWNGPVGAFEFPPFDGGTTALAQRAAELTESGALRSVAGGGDTVAALAAAGVEQRFSYVSTAGGAFLEWLEGKTLPGVAVLAQ